MNNNKQKNQHPETITTADGLMTFGKTEGGLNVLDFKSIESVEIEPFAAICKVQAMRGGNVYITQKPPRVHNRPLFRDDNCSLTLGRDGKCYFVFTLPAALLDQLPERLVTQAKAIARKWKAANADPEGKNLKTK